MEAVAPVERAQRQTPFRISLAVAILRSKKRTGRVHDATSGRNPFGRVDEYLPLHVLKL